MVAGDSAVTPSFWYGDLYALHSPGSPDGMINAGSGDAAGYLLGRVDFGLVAGGYCDRSADGSRLAFNYTLLSNTTASQTWLRWLDLREVSSVHNPLPELNMVSPPSWAPQGYRMAFSACNANQECGVYLFEGDDQPALLLSSRVSSYLPPLWKPDGTQVAVMVPSEAGDPPGVAVIDIATRTIIMYTSADVSAVKDWGVRFLESMRAFERCSMPR